jgi:putative flippase GtrA
LSLKPSTFSALLRYFVVATCGFCADFLIFALLVTLGMSVYLANAIGFCIGAIVNLILIRKFVFPNSRFQLITDLPLTLLLNGAMLGLGMGMLWLLVELVSINPYWAKLLVNGTTFILNYLTRAVFFRKK